MATLYGLEGFSEPRPVNEYQESAKGMSGLVRECITVSRSLASELSHPAFTEPDLCTALGWLGAWTLEKHGVEVTVNCAETITAEVEETRVTLLQAVRELLFNVVKHAGVREAVVDLARTPDGHVSVSVSDSGVGFEPGSALVPGQSAGGIGLFSMRERLDVIGGGMKIESAIGNGTRVTVWVPADRGPSTPPAAAPTTGQTSGRPSEDGRGAAHGPALPRRASGKIRVLLVDDHAVVREGIALQLLQQPDIEIVGEAADGATAVELVRSLRPDVVTMDVNMPGMNGIDAARAIHAELPRNEDHRPVDVGGVRAGRRDANAGAVHYLSKSASLDKLLAAIRDPSDRE